MTRSSIWTERWVPEGSTELKAPEANAVVYVYDLGGRPSAIGYSGRRKKPDFHNTYSDEDHRLRHINRWRQGLAKTIAYKEELKAKRKAANAKGHSVPVGAIFDHTWGYEQTNNDFYQVVSVTKCTVTVRKIASELVSGMETGPMAGHVVACPDEFVGEPFRKRVQYIREDEPYLSFEFGWCKLWDGKPQYESWYH